MEPREPARDSGGVRKVGAGRRGRPALRAGLAAIVASLAASCAEPEGVRASDPAEAAAATITATGIASWIGRLAHDSMGGRPTPGERIESAAAAVGLHLADLGLEPLRSEYVRHYEVPANGATAPGTLAPNVAAALIGRDPQLAAEYVVFVAHLDHVGVGLPINGDSIYNGADDNASGTAGLLGVAGAFAALPRPPLRSVIFLSVSGEEHGFWGSQAFVVEAPVPVDRIVAVLNLDMISRHHPDTVQVGGRERSTLGDVVWRQAATRPEVGLTVTDGPGGGSDHLPFMSRGIPFLFFHTGVHPDYHMPSDEPSRVDPDKAARVARLAFYTGLAVAEQSARPQWLPGWP